MSKGQDSKKETKKKPEKTMKEKKEAGNFHLPLTS